MRIVIVIPSEAFLASAGMRIRYGRLMAMGSALGAEIGTRAIDTLDPSKPFDADVYVFSKTFGVDAVILAAALQARGKTVALDLFDDYFSQPRDPRLARYRTWLGAMARFAATIIVSTPTMAAIARQFAPQTPVTVVGDPVEAFDPSALARPAELDRPLDVVWFGIGDNPFFPVGISDLAAHAGALCALRGLGGDARLHIVTNRRALDAKGLARLKTLPLPFRISEWTEEVEADALRQADLAFIPVSGQSFSRAKSLNRCLTALCHGCNVLTVGYPLYEPLDAFIYRSAQAYLSDRSHGREKLRPARVAKFQALLGQLADPNKAAQTFVEALMAANGRAAPATKAQRPSFLIVHGMTSESSTHKLASRLGALSIRSPFHRGELNYHLRFDVRAGVLAVLVSEAAAKLLPAKMIADATPVGTIVSSNYLMLSADDLGVRRLRIDGSMAQDQLVRLTLYRPVMSFIDKVCALLFGPTPLIISDKHPLAASLQEPPLGRWRTVQPRG